VERLADLANFAARPGCHDLRKAAAPHYHRAGIDKRQIVAARSGAAGRDAGGCNLAHRYRLPRQQRFISLKIAALHQHGVGGNAVAFGEHNQIAARHLAPGDALARAVSDHQRTGAGEVAQRFQHALGARFLNDSDRHRQDSEYEQDKRFFQISEQEVDKAAAEQECEHRFAKNL
jgi:hypothetical protein